MSNPVIPMLGFFSGSMSGGEILLIMLAMLLLFGSKKLPSMARNLGKSIESFRRASRDVTDEIMRADLEDDERPANKTRATGPAESDAPAGDQAGPEIVVKPSGQSVGRNHDRAG